MGLRLSVSNRNVKIGRICNFGVTSGLNVEFYLLAEPKQLHILTP